MQRKRHCGGKRSKIRTLLIALVAVMVLLCMIIIIKTETYPASNLSRADILIIDAGHGGIDGGAQGSDGTPEKDINLDVSMRIAELAENDGWRVVMTRDTDELLGSAQGGIHSRKTADLKERKRIIDDTKPLLAVSIHLNSFKQDRSVHGAQVFYPWDGSDSQEKNTLEQSGGNPYIESKRLAEVIQQSLITGIDDGTNRKALSKKDILIFKEITVPIVLVECGFLSNYEEAQKLQNDDYKQKLAECIYSGIMTYSKKENKKNIFLKDSLTRNTG